MVCVLSTTSFGKSKRHFRAGRQAHNLDPCHCLHKRAWATSCPAYIEYRNKTQKSGKFVLAISLYTQYTVCAAKQSACNGKLTWFPSQTTAGEEVAHLSASHYQSGSSHHGRVRRVFPLQYVDLDFLPGCTTVRVSNGTHVCLYTSGYLPSVQRVALE